VPIIPDELRALAELFPERVALRVIDRGDMTFSQWERWSNATGRGLARRGVTRGDRVLLLLPPGEAQRFQISYFAAHKAGAIAVPVNPRYAARELEHVVANSEPTVIVTGGDQAVRAAAAAAGRGTTIVGDAEWVDLAADDDRPFQVELRGGDYADILYTSGSTGLPKGVASTHDNVLANPAAPMERDAKLLQSIPLPTAFGTYGAQLMALRFGLTNVHLPAFDPARFASLISAERPAWVLMVPAHAMLLIESGALKGLDTSSVRMLLYGSAPMPPHAVQVLAEAFPRATLLNGYGLTEGGGSSCTMPPGEALERPGSVGKPVDGVSVRLVDGNGEEVGPGQVGEVTIKLAAGQRSYWNDPEATARTWRDGWVYSGDLGYFDADGFLYLVDRKKDMIIRGGYNVYSIEVESALYEHPDVVEVAVIGLPHDVLGQDVCAVVRLRDDALPVTLDGVRTFLADRLADFKLPRRLVVRTEPLPRSGMQKIDKRALLAEVAGS
jgi:acyl-CoA synthetase (AMP-forming)/AMP-acid ligase II